jgi:hypothetical protein
MHGKMSAGFEILTGRNGKFNELGKKNHNVT